jgi:hypothetical protein
MAPRAWTPDMFCLSYRPASSLTSINVVADAAVIAAAKLSDETGAYWVVRPPRFCVVQAVIKQQATETFLLWQCCRDRESLRDCRTETQYGPVRKDAPHMDESSRRQAANAASQMVMSGTMKRTGDCTDVARRDPFPEPDV